MLATGAIARRDHPDTLLAGIILVDPMPRNISSGLAASAAGRLVASLTLKAIDRGIDR